MGSASHLTNDKLHELEFLLLHDFKSPRLATPGLDPEECTCESSITSSFILPQSYKSLILVNEVTEQVKGV